MMNKIETHVAAWICLTEKWLVNRNFIRLRLKESGDAVWRSDGIRVIVEMVLLNNMSKRLDVQGEQDWTKDGHLWNTTG